MFLPLPTGSLIEELSLSVDSKIVDLDTLKMVWLFCGEKRRGRGYKISTYYITPLSLWIEQILFIVDKTLTQTSKWTNQKDRLATNDAASKCHGVNKYLSVLLISI